MPRIGSDPLTNFNQGHFGFSAEKPDDLGATEYTLVCIAVDRSGSTVAFTQEMESCIKEVVKSCQQSPRADNLLLRIVAFDSKQDELHGFKQLNNCALDDYDHCLNPGGMTALNDATISCVEAVSNYGKTLTEEDYEVNAIIIVITDGCENSSTLSDPKYVKAAFQKVVQDESLESLISILVGVGNEVQVLNDFQKDVGITQYVEIADANQSQLAKLANFISQSISSQSSALGTGKPSQSLQF